MQLEDRIGQRIGHTERRQRWSKRANDNRSTDRPCAADDETGDQSIVSALDKAARTDVKKVMLRRLNGHERRRVEVTLEDDAFRSIGSVSERRAILVVGHDEIPS